MNKSQSKPEIFPLLIGNTFPLSLIRRRVVICPASLLDLRSAIVGSRVISFWGHGNTLSAASEFVGFDLTPSCPRPVLRLSSSGYPNYAGFEYRSCWVVSPDYHQFFRPLIGEEVSAAQIASWQILHLCW